MIVRTDPSHHRLAYLSIPRDLLVSIPTVGTAKINAAYQYGGPALAIKTIEAFTGIPIDHVVIVDFDSFKELIDAEGGITIDVPENILSNRFDCPYADPGPLPAVAGLALPQGRPAHERRAGADLLAHPREPAQPGRQRPDARGAPAGGHPGGGGEAALVLDLRVAALRRQLAAEAR